MTARKPKSRQRTALAIVRLLPAEHDRLKEAAAERGVSVSTLLREGLATAGIICATPGEAK